MKKLLLLLLLIFIPAFCAEAAKPIKVLIVPGHDDQSWGTQYGEHKEADMNVEVATRIFEILKDDKRFKPYITRDESGYTKEFDKYFSKSAKSIASFRDKAKKAHAKKIEKGSFEEVGGVAHNDVNERVSIILYGINKWAKDKDMDAVIHVHFNDHPRPIAWAPGVYEGFAVYYPEEQMSNSAKSRELGEKIRQSLGENYLPSNYPPESGGLVPDQSLIAMGSNGTLSRNVRSLLVEYEYIYKFENSVDYSDTYQDMAAKTAKGIREYFSKK